MDERPSLHHAIVGIGITIGDPPLAVWAYASHIVVFSAAPDGVGRHKPEWRGIGSGRQVDVNIRLLLAQFFYQMNRGGEVAVKGASREDRIGIARSVEFELIDVVLVNHVEANIAEARVVLRSREREPVTDDLKTLHLPVLQPLFLGSAVAAPRRHPDAGTRTIYFRGLPHFGESVGKISGIEAPQ